MKRRTSIVALGIGLAVLGWSCERLDNQFPKTKEELLRPKTWTITDLVKGPPGGATSSVFSSLELCERDDEFRFRSENRLYVNSGARRCDSSELQEYRGSWTLKNDILLEMYTPYDTVALFIEELTAENMRAYYDEMAGTTLSRYTFVFSGK
jgi:hypothetical protein